MCIPLGKDTYVRSARRKNNAHTNKFFPTSTATTIIMQNQDTTFERTFLYILGFVFSGYEHQSLSSLFALTLGHHKSSIQRKMKGFSLFLATLCMKVLLVDGRLAKSGSNKKDGSIHYAPSDAICLVNGKEQSKLMKLLLVSIP